MSSDETGGAATADSDRFERLLKAAAQTSRVEAAPPIAVDSVLADGKLHVRRRIGEGGLGVVYQAHDRERGVDVALKTLQRLDAAAIYRLKNEFRALRDVSHENLARLFDLYHDAERWFFTMELIDGAPLDRALRDGASLRETFAQLARGVCAIHAAEKLHRDLKPSNVLVTPAGRVVILDFGLASAPEAGGVGQTLAQESTSGTPAYMAPEQAAGRGASEASDWYAVGVMLYEALTGKLPFEGTAGEIMARKQVSAALSRARGALRAMPSRQQGALWLHGGHDVALAAAIAAFAGNDEQAESLLEAAEGAFEAKHWPGMVACARHARGGLLGGDTGAALRADAEAQMRALGAVDLRAFVLTLAPGLWLD